MSSILDRHERIRRLLKSNPSIKYNPAPESNVFEDNHTSASIGTPQVHSNHHTRQKEEGTAEKNPYQDIKSAHSVIQTDSENASTTGCSRESEPNYPLYEHLHTGELPLPDVNFVSYRELLRFLQIHTDRNQTLEVSSNYFRSENFFERHWDFFYIYPPLEISSKAILCLPLPQVEHFFWTINQDLGTQIKLPTTHTENPALIMDCHDDGTPRPRYIAPSKSYSDSLAVKQAVPGRSYEHLSGQMIYKEPTEEQIAAYREQIEALAVMDKAKKQQSKKKKAIDRLVRQQAMNHELKRVQRYLGLRKGAQYDLANLKIDKDEGKGKLKFTSQQDSEVPFQQESSVVFICVDVEAYERNHNVVTEVGIATLDTADIRGIAPGENACNWMNKIGARHFGIKEHRNYQNTEFCQGNRDGFVFGKTEWISLYDAASYVAECFEGAYSECPNVECKAPAGSLCNCQDPRQPNRNIVFVGHDVDQDIAYLKKIKYDASRLSNIIELIDTAHMYQSIRREPNRARLANVLSFLEIDACNLHNAGNDAVYTLQAMLGMAVKASVDKVQIYKMHKAELISLAKEAAETAKNSVMDSKQGWSSGGEDSDGGAPDPPFERKVKKGYKKSGRPIVTDPVLVPWDQVVGVAKAGNAWAHGGRVKQERVMAAGSWRTPYDGVK